MTLKCDLDAAAASLLRHALSLNDAVDLEAKLDIFKIVSGYYIGTRRVIKGEDPSDGQTFSDIAARTKGHDQ